MGCGAGAAAVLPFPPTPSVLPCVCDLQVAHLNVSRGFTPSPNRSVAPLPRRDAEHGEREGDPRPRFPEAAARGWVEYVELDSAQRVYRAINQMRAHQPVLLRGTPLVAGLVGRWSFRHLVSQRRRREVGGRGAGREKSSGHHEPVQTPFVALRRQAALGRTASCACCARTPSAAASSSATTPRTCTAGGPAAVPAPPQRHAPRTHPLPTALPLLFFSLLHPVSALTCETAARPPPPPTTPHTHRPPPACTTCASRRRSASTWPSPTLCSVRRSGAHAGCMCG
jgi:hypothetical protein